MGRHISLFAGLGGDFLGSQALGFTPVASAEIDPWLRKLLNLRFPHALDLGDVRQVDGAGLRSIFGGTGTLLSGGFPCQDLSAPGYGNGLQGHRSGLYRELMRLTAELSPQYVLIENVSVLRNKGLEKLLAALQRLNYDVRWDCITAASLGAQHMRDRIWIAAVKRPSDPILAAGIGRLRFEALSLLRSDRLGLLNIAGGVHNGNFGSRYKEDRYVSRFPRSGCMIGRDVYARPPLTVAKRLPGLWPTPTRSDGTGGPGVSPKRTGGKNLRTAAGGSLNPEWVEYLMGVPRGWTDLDKPNSDVVPFKGFTSADHYPRTVNGRMKDRGRRIQALGNALVPAVFELSLRNLIEW